MKILIVDDSTDKLSDIISVIRETSNSFEIESSSNCIDAINKLRNKFDLIILDLLLPLREGDDPSPSNGEHVVKEIYRNTRLKPPTYILCLTQFDELITDFHPIWRTLKYDPSTIQWKLALRELMIYITRQYSTEDRIIIEKVPTIYLEGKTDLRIYEESMRLFFPSLVNRINIKSDIGAGADWVTRQLIIWASSLPKNEAGQYIKSAGVYDNDSKGKEAIEELHRNIGHTSAESKCVKAFKYNQNYAKHLIPIYKKGIKLPICLEEMFDSVYWRFAALKNWLVDREDEDFLLEDPTRWNKREMSLNDHIKSLGLTENEKLYLNKVCRDKKSDFCSYVLSLNQQDRKAALSCMSIFLKDVIGYIMESS
ncbi:MAG: hypothetical protein ACJ75B_12390 [Flavisolibacter sp.]